MSYYSTYTHCPKTEHDKDRDRQQAIERGRRLKDDPNYPSEEIISEIALRLVGKWLQD